MKKVLSLLLASSSIFSMHLQMVPYDQKSDNYCRKSVYIQPQSEIGINRFESKKTPIDSASVFVPNRLGLVELYHSKKGFSVQQYNEKQLIQKHLVDKLVRNMTKEELKSFLKIGYFTLNQMNNGEYTLQAVARINGGGPMLGTAMYWVTKSLCYAVGVTATAVTAGGAVAAVAVTGGTAAPALAGAGAIAGSVATTTVAAAGTAIGTGAVITTTAGVVAATAATGGSVAVAAGLAGTGAAAMTAVAGGAAIGTTAVTTTAAVVSSAGGIGATIAGIEAVSVAVGTFFGMLPTP